MPIVIRGLSFAHLDSDVLHNVNATFDEGMVHLIVGCTGSGKSTLALLLAGLLKPRQGSITVDDLDPASGSFDRTLLQLAFQFPETQIFEVSVEKEIGYGLRNFGVEPDESSRRCHWALQRVGLDPDLLERDPSSLSFGERRKVALASVIALRPGYLVLDEPLAGLDWNARKGLVETIHGLAGEGLTVLVLTHEADMVGEIGDTVSVIGEGGMSGPMKVDDFLDKDAPDTHGMLPEYVLALKRLEARGVPAPEWPGSGEPGEREPGPEQRGRRWPRRPDEVSAAILEALNLPPGESG